MLGAEIELAGRPVESLTAAVDVDVDAHTGTAVVSISLPVTPGRDGLSPQLALTFRATGGSSSVGLGWSLDGPAVTVDTADRLPRYDGRDRFRYGRGARSRDGHLAYP